MSLSIQKAERFIKIYPWYSGFNSDLLFFVAIDTLFFTVVKNFSAAQIASLTTVSMFSCIILQLPILWVMQKIGNTASARTGSIFLLLSSVLITFGPNYITVAAGRVFRDVATVFRNASFISLENNLELVERRAEYTIVRTKGNTIYAVITMLISFVASMMFNLNNYLPMYSCVAASAIGLVLSFFMVDCSGNDRQVPERKKENQKTKFSYGKLIALALIVYGIFYSLVQQGQNEGKLFIQQQLLIDFDIHTTSLIIGVMLCMSRIIRVLSNLAFYLIYKKHGEKVGILLTALLCTSAALILFGSFIPHVVTKIIVMGIGYMTILFIRDPFRLYMQDVVLNNTANEYHRSLLIMLEFAYLTASALISFSFTLVLLKYPMITAITIMFVISLIEIILSIILYKHVIKAKRAKELQYA